MARVQPTTKKGRSLARQKVKNGRRRRRPSRGVGRRTWLKRRPVLVGGPGGTQKGGKNAGRAPKYSDADAMSPHADQCRKDRAAMERASEEMHDALVA